MPHIVDQVSLGATACWSSKHKGARSCASNRVIHPSTYRP
jgi:hypothetical protein